MLGSRRNFSTPSALLIEVLPILKWSKAPVSTVRKSLYCEKMIDFEPGSCSRSQRTCRAMVSILVP